MNRYIALNNENIVASIRFGKEITQSEVKSDIGELGQKMLEDGTFIDIPTQQPQPHEPTNSEIAKMISELQADLVIKGVI